MNLSAHISDPPKFLGLLSHEIRWKLLQALAVTDLHVQELVEVVNRPQNVVSYHLRLLLEQGILRERRSLADGREIYYSLDLDTVRASYLSAGESLHPALGGSTSQAPDSQAGALPTDPVRVLFLCTHNSARSQIAEAILRTRANGKIEVYSAGTEATSIQPLAVRVLSEMHIDIGDQFSKTMERYLDQKFDYIITVCDRARESCPIFPGDPVRIHWSFPDPAAVEGTEEVRYAAFKETALQMMQRISYLTLMIERQAGISLK